MIATTIHVYCDFDWAVVGSEYVLANLSVSYVIDDGAGNPDVIKSPADISLASVGAHGPPAVLSFALVEFAK